MAPSVLLLLGALVGVAAGYLAALLLHPARSVPPTPSPALMPDNAKLGQLTQQLTQATQQIQTLRSELATAQANLATAQQAQQALQATIDALPDLQTVQAAEDAMQATLGALNATPAPTTATA